MLGLITILVFAVILWIVCLLFWPLLAIPDSALRRKGKYQSITSFEEAVKKKYGTSQGLDFSDENII